MAIYSIWESSFPSEVSAEGREVTERIWDDMTRFDGYLAHQLLEDLDDPGHLLIVSRWSSRQRADDVLSGYRDHPNALRANSLVHDQAAGCAMRCSWR